jgi:hypothetical protein
MISLVPSAQLLVASLIGMPKVAPVQLALYNAMLERLVSTLQVGGLSAQLAAVCRQAGFNVCRQAGFKVCWLAGVNFCRLAGWRALIASSAALLLRLVWPSR